MAWQDWNFKIFGKRAELPGHNLRGVYQNLFGLGRGSVFRFILSMGEIWGRFKYSSKITKKFYSKYRYKFLIRNVEPLMLFDQDLIRYRKMRRDYYTAAPDSYRGLRINFGLPCRGQRTHTNASNAFLAKKFRTRRKKKIKIKKIEKLLLNKLILDCMSKFGWKKKLYSAIYFHYVFEAEKKEKNI